MELKEKKHRARNREQYNGYQERYRSKDRDRYNAYYREYYKTHPIQHEKHLEYMRMYHERKRMEKDE